MTQGDNYYAAKNYFEAIKSYADAEKLKPGEMRKLFNAPVKNGDALNAQENYPAAFDYYKKAATMDYHDEEICKKIFNLFGSSNIDDEENFCKALTTANPNDTGAHIVSGVFYLKTGEYDKALASLQIVEASALKEWQFPLLKDTLLRSKKLTGIKYLKAKRYDEAIKYLDDVLNLATEDFEAFYLIGLAYEQKGDYSSAKKYFKKALKLAPNNFDVNEARLKTSNKKKNTDNADEFSELIEKEELELCNKDYNKAIELNPSYAKAYNNRGKTYEEMNQFKKALQDYQKALKLAPNSEAAKQGIKRLSKKY